jgi:hypothetical protein
MQFAALARDAPHRSSRSIARAVANTPSWTRLAVSYISAIWLGVSPVSAPCLYELSWRTDFRIPVMWSAHPARTPLHELASSRPWLLNAETRQRPYGIHHFQTDRYDPPNRNERACYL